MTRIILLFSFFALSTSMFADDQMLLDELDATISKREQFILSKEKKIDFIKKKLHAQTDSIAMLKTLNELYHEYYVFKFDSALTVAHQGLSLAERQKDHDYIDLFRINLAEILAIGGLYTEAVNTLELINTEDINPKYLFKYYFTFFSTYSYWSDYCHDQTFSPNYRKKGNDYLQLAMQHADSSDPYYQYYQGEQNVYVNPDPKAAREYYHHILSTVPEESRVYAMAAFALAGNYKEGGDLEKYEEFLIKASLSDLKCCTMENVALQTLALLLFQKDDDHIERAERYIYTSMEDAKYYNNRLRILEISRIMPQIMSSYQAVVKKQNKFLRYAIFFISLLVIGLLCTSFYIQRQNRKLAARRKDLAENNEQLIALNQQLADSNQHQAELNRQLEELNTKLVDTNKRREGLASIYIDLCAKYIDKLGKYQTLVKRKIKANQTQELLQTISSARISEEDAATFLNRFDKAFLELYPTFTEEFNALLTEDARIQPKSPVALTTELRTFALIRLGVKSTADIAGLLFLSIQTIYNCRSVIKNKAINKETFDEDVLKLCTVIQ
ncbi:MAG: hypothetical protein IJ546_03255 [Prevotella sp.]|nr:hypothetical protein [Prevotella sp.]